MDWIEITGQKFRPSYISIPYYRHEGLLKLLCSFYARPGARQSWGGGADDWGEKLLTNDKATEGPKAFKEKLEAVPHSTIFLVRNISSSNHMSLPNQTGHILHFYLLKHITIRV